ncbi:MAG: hypothetical protein RL572_495 [Pseudomonadota bacterium]|jgi:hypothetical protein
MLLLRRQCFKNCLRRHFNAQSPGERAPREAKAVQELQRITTEYVEAEDRLRLTGELSPGDTRVLWLSQRLMLRLLPHLCLWLEKQRGTAFPPDIEQSLELRAATERMGHEDPVRPTPHCLGWLVLAVDINTAGPVLCLSLRGDKEAESVALNLPPLALRQWLNILHTLWSTAQWPASPWPDWVAQTDARRSADKRALH